MAPRSGVAPATLAQDAERDRAGDELRAGAVAGRADAVRGGQHRADGNAPQSGYLLSLDSHDAGIQGQSSHCSRRSARWRGCRTAPAPRRPWVPMAMCISACWISRPVATTAAAGCCISMPTLALVKTPGSFGWDDTPSDRARQRGAVHTPAARRICCCASTTTTTARARGTASTRWPCSIRMRPARCLRRRGHRDAGSPGRHRPDGRSGHRGRTPRVVREHRGGGSRQRAPRTSTAKMAARTSGTSRPIH